MSATETAIRVVEWAMAGSGPPPRGDPLDPEGLAHPGDRLARALGQLTSITAARLRLGSPPLGDRGPVGPGGAILAAALGVAHAPELVKYLLRAAPEADGDAE